jgi:alpha/beta superfamily hydrolase
MSEAPVLRISFQSQVRTIDTLRGPAGRLEALLNTGLDAAPFAAVVAHPHPLFGGTMHNKVVYHAMKAFTHFGLPVLRFNFRGAGLSEGKHDEARGEVDDVRAAVNFLYDELPETFGKPILFAGFSFGSNVGLRATCGDPRVQGVVGLGLPVKAAGRNYTYDFLAGCPQPKLFISGDHDEFCPQAVLDAFLSAAPEPKQRVIIAGADHFFQGIPGSPDAKLDQMQGVLKTWLSETFQLE